MLSWILTMCEANSFNICTVYCQCSICIVWLKCIKRVILIGIHPATYFAVPYSMRREGGVYTAPTRSTTPSVATSWSIAESTWTVLVGFSHVKVGHPHPTPGPTSCVGLVTILVSCIARGCALYPVLSWCTPGRDRLARVSWVLERPFRRQNLLWDYLLEVHLLLLL